MTSSNQPTRIHHNAVWLIAVAFSVGCSGSSTAGSGDATATGGATDATGGATQAAVTGSSFTGGSGGLATTAVTSASGGTIAASGGSSSGPLTTGGVAGTGGAGTSGGAGGSSSTKLVGGSPASGGSSASAGTKNSGGTKSAGGTANVGGNSTTGGTASSGGTKSLGGSSASGGNSTTGGAAAAGGTSGCASGPIATFTGALTTGITFLDTDGNAVNAHGGGIIKEGDTYYMHGEYFLSTTTDNNFNGFSMYSSKDLATWKNEGIILPQQPSGELGPDRKGERPHIVKCPSTGEFVLYAHAASTDYETDKEVVYATSQTVNGQYSYKGPLTNASGTTASHSDMSALSDGDTAYVVTESGHLYTLAADCHSWLSDKTYSAVNGDSGGSESPTVFKAGSTYYWIGSYKTGWRANNNFYSTAPAITGPWTYQGYIAPVTDPSNDISDQRTWLSQSTWVQPVVGCQGTVYVYWGDHWYGDQDTTNPGKHNDQATYVFQPLVFSGTAISMPTYLSPWKLDVGYGTWSQ